ncbi:hypothetical protein EJ110_NYTH47297 [Nymphaea thermarum]|nr:hypothetical protein EJ110_NYTH47297 [Nymphaea thermarum]
MAALCRRDVIDVTSGYLDLYLCIADSPTQHGQWSVDAEFSLAVVDQKLKESFKENMEHSFTDPGDHCGLGSFISFRNLHCLYKGHLLNDTCVAEVGVTFEKVVVYITYHDGCKEEATEGQGGAAAPTKLGSDGCRSTGDEKKNAYDVVLRCLYQEGEHTWEKEALLTELRLAMGISSSDHAMYLKHVLSGGLGILNVLG